MTSFQPNQNHVGDRLVKKGSGGIQSRPLIASLVFIAEHVNVQWYREGVSRHQD